jgi:hypothetical protein
MSTFLDMMCACGQRFGWSGEAQDAPPCSKCGAKVESFALAADAAEVEKFRELLRARHRFRWARPEDRDAARAEFKRLLDEAAKGE